MINIRQYFSQTNLNSIFFCYPVGTKGTHIWCVKGCMHYALLVFDFNGTREPVLLLRGGTPVPRPRDRPGQRCPPPGEVSKCWISEPSTMCLLFTDGENTPGLWGLSVWEGAEVQRRGRSGFRTLQAHSASGHPTSPRALLLRLKSKRNENHSLGHNAHSASSHLLLLFF